jgi:hypothetical protein
MYRAADLRSKGCLEQLDRAEMCLGPIRTFRLLLPYVHPWYKIWLKAGPSVYLHREPCTQAHITYKLVCMAQRRERPQHSSCSVYIRDRVSLLQAQLWMFEPSVAMTTPVKLCCYYRRCEATIHVA